MKPFYVLIALMVVAYSFYHIGYNKGTDDYYQLQVDYARRVQMRDAAPDVEWEIVEASPVNHVEQCAVYHGKIIGVAADGKPICQF